MAETGVWLAMAESQAAPLNAVAECRETHFVPIANQLPALIRCERYTAFNVKRSVLVAETANVPQSQTEFAADSSIVCTALNARKCADFVQEGETDAVAVSPILYSVLFNIPADWHEEFDSWYDQEHIPMIMACREWAGSKRYHVQGGPHTHLALHYIKSASAFDAPSLKAARLTPWRNRLVQHRWFTDVDKMIHFKEGGQ